MGIRIHSSGVNPPLDNGLAEAWLQAVAMIPTAGDDIIDRARSLGLIVVA